MTRRHFAANATARAFAAMLAVTGGSAIAQDAAFRPLALEALGVFDEVAWRRGGEPAPDARADATDARGDAPAASPPAATPASTPAATPAATQVGPSPPMLGRVVALVGVPADPARLDALLPIVAGIAIEPADFAVLGVAIAAPRDPAVERIAARFGWPLGCDPRARVRTALGVEDEAWIALVDRLGIVREVFASPTAELGASLRARIATLRGRRVEPLLGAPFGAMRGVRWPSAEPHRFADAELTLVRYWTDRCPFCAASLPAIASLQELFAARGLALLPIHHPKRRDVPAPAALQDLLAGHGVRADLAVDPEWTTLRALMERGELREATSISVLVDRAGRVRWVHRGPRLHPSAQAGHGSADADYRELEELLDLLLPAAPQKSR